MTALRKITVQVSETDLALAQAYTGVGVSGRTVLAALKRLASMQVQRELRKLRGKVKIFDDLARDEVRPRMSALRKITIEVPEHDLALAQRLTGEGVTETVRTALKRLASIQAQQEFRKLRGSFKFTVDLDELREDR